jgi:hypothetical protein
LFDWWFLRITWAYAGIHSRGRLYPLVQIRWLIINLFKGARARERKRQREREREREPMSPIPLPTITASLSQEFFIWSCRCSDRHEFEAETQRRRIERSNICCVGLQTVVKLSVLYNWFSRSRQTCTIDSVRSCDLIFMSLFKDMSQTL